MKPSALLAEVRDELATMPLDGSPALPVVVEALRDLLHAEQAGSYHVAWNGGGWSATSIVFAPYRGRDHDCERVREFWLRAPRTFALYDPVRPAPAHRNVPMAFSAEQARQNPIGEGLARTALDGQAQCRVLLCEGQTFLGWLGAFRREPFRRRETRLLAALTPSLRQRLSLERAMASAEQAATIEAVLDALPFPAMIVRAGVGVQQANPGACAMLDGPAAPIVAAIDDYLRGRGRAPPGATFTKLSAPGVPALALVTFRGQAYAQRARRARAEHRWRLTPREGEVLAYVAEGLSNKEIAARCGCSAKTVEHHVTALLAKSTLAGRAALVRAFWAPG